MKVYRRGRRKKKSQGNIQFLRFFVSHERFRLSECVPSNGVDLFPRIKLHLVENKVLSNGPGREVYEIAAGKFFTYRSARGDKNSSFWTPLLHHENLDVRVVAWKKSAELVTAVNVDPSFRESQLRDALVEAEKAIDKSPIEDPNFEEALFEFLYVIITESDRDNTSNIDPPMFLNFIQRLATHLSEKLNDKKYYVRAAFLKLLGALYGQTSKHPNVRIDFNYLPNFVIILSFDKAEIFLFFFSGRFHVRRQNSDLRIVFQKFLDGFLRQRLQISCFTNN